MVVETVKKWGRARFCLSWNNSYTLYILMKVLLVKFKKPLNFSMPDSKLLRRKTETKNVKVAKMVGFIESLTSTLTSLMLVTFSALS